MREEIATFLDQVYGNGQGWTAVCHFSGGTFGKGQLNREVWFEMPRQAGEMADFIADHTNWDLYFTPYLFPGRKRDKDAVGVWTRSVYADLDDCDPALLKVEPTLLWETSPGRHQAIWTIEDEMSALDASELAHGLAYAHKDDGCDTSGWDIGQLLRIPGSTHNKRSPHRIAMPVQGPSHTMDAFMEHYEGIVAAQAPKVGTSAVREPVESVPAHISRRLEATGVKDRSRERWSLIQVCVEWGMTDGQVLTVLDAHPATQGIVADNAHRDMDTLHLNEIAKHRMVHDHTGESCTDADCPNTPEWMTAAKVARLDTEEFELEMAAIEMDDSQPAPETVKTKAADPQKAPVKPLAKAAALKPAVKRSVSLTPASKAVVKRVKWLWDTTPEGATPTSQGRIPLKSLVLGAGSPGVGKSQFAVWIAARITRGELPGEHFGTPKGVVYAATEDSWDMTIVPRLIAAGADLDRVYRVDVSSTDARGARLSLPDDTSGLVEAMAELDVVLLVCDPLLSVLTAKLDDHRANQVREAVEPLVKAADENEFTIYGLAHFTKGGDGDPLARVAGSGAFGQLTRSLIAFSKRDNAEDGEPPFIASLEKNNLGRTGMPSHLYDIVPVTVEAEDGKSYVSKIVIAGESMDSVGSQMETAYTGGGAAVREAQEWLTAFLGSEGEVESRVAKAKAKEEHISESSLKRATKVMGVKVRRTGSGASATSYWSLSV